MAVPLQILSIEDNMAKVHSDGVDLSVSIDLIEDAKEGDYVIVHAGYAIQKLDPKEAKETLAVFDRLHESWENE